MWLRRLIWFTAGLTLLLICSGGMVTSKGAGLAVPDWPTSFGYNMFLFPASQWVGGVLFEHTHRLIASTVGMVTLILAVWLWARETEGAQRWIGIVIMTCGVSVLGIRTQPVHIALGGLAVLVIFMAIWQARQTRGALRWFGVVALAAVILQGVLGGLRVTLLKDQIGIFHALLAQAFLALLVTIALSTTNYWRSLAENFASGSRIRAARNLVVVTTILIYLQLGLGATMRHQHRDLSLLDFPTANGAWIPDTSDSALAKVNDWRNGHGLSEVSAFQIWLQMAHRFLAIVIVVALITCAHRVLKESGDNKVLRRLARGWVALVVCQVTLGAWTIWSNKAADVATTHVAVGACLLSFGVMISAICSRMNSSAPVRNSAPLISEPRPVLA